MKEILWQNKDTGPQKLTSHNFAASPIGSKRLNSLYEVPIPQINITKQCSINSKLHQALKLVMSSGLAVKPSFLRGRFQHQKCQLWKGLIRGHQYLQDYHTSSISLINGSHCDDLCWTGKTSLGNLMTQKTPPSHAGCPNFTRKRHVERPTFRTRPAESNAPVSHFAVTLPWKATNFTWDLLQVMGFLFSAYMLEVYEHIPYILRSSRLAGKTKPLLFWDGNFSGASC